MKHTHTTHTHPWFSGHVWFSFPIWGHHFAGAGEVIGCPKRPAWGWSKITKPSGRHFLKRKKRYGASPSAMEHAYTVLILEFFFGETLWGLILRDILSWLEVMCHWSLRKLITWLSFNGLYKNIGAKNTSSVRFSLLLCSKQIPIWSIQMFNASLHARCFFTVLSRDDPRTSHKQWTESHPGPPTVFTVHGLIGMLYWVPKVDN